MRRHGADPRRSRPLVSRFPTHERIEDPLPQFGTYPVPSVGPADDHMLTTDLYSQATSDTTSDAAGGF